MADNPTTVLLPVLPIEDLPYAMEVTSDSKFPMSQHGMAMKVLGDQIADFARKSAAPEVQRAAAAADAAEKSKASAKAEADRAAQLRNSIEVDYDELHQAVEEAGVHADRSKSEAVRAKGEADRSAENATISKSWAVGGTGTRQGEDRNNARYWSDRAQAEAERASVPPVEGVYNIVLEDRITGERYALIIERGRPALLGVSDTLEATSPTIIDHTDGKAYGLIVEGGKLKIEKAA